jgi:plastocyanin
VQVMRRIQGAALAAVIVAGVFLQAGPGGHTVAQAQSAQCQFILGFETLRNLIGPQTVGNCLEDQRFAANGNAEQRTTGGLMVWRKADNWTAFTNGYETWLNGPMGLQRRLNTERFTWEGDTISMRANRFAPAQIEVTAGTTLSWVNLDPEDHNVVTLDLTIESPLIGPGETWSHTFIQPGTYHYVCDLHANMEGVVTVTG